MKSHFFESDVDGGLYDTRNPQWSQLPPIRPIWSRAFETIETVQQFKATLRHGGFTFPGCYPLYFVTSDGGALSFEAARQEFRLIAESIASGTSDGWRVTGCLINYEDSGLFCDHSGKRIESAYGESAAEEE